MRHESVGRGAWSNFTFTVEYVYFQTIMFCLFVLLTGWRIWRRLKMDENECLFLACMSITEIQIWTVQCVNGIYFFVLHFTKKMKMFINPTVLFTSKVLCWNLFLDMNGNMWHTFFLTMVLRYKVKITISYEKKFGAVNKFIYRYGGIIYLTNIVHDNVLLSEKQLVLIFFYEDN